MQRFQSISWPHDIVEEMYTDSHSIFKKTDMRQEHLGNGTTDNNTLIIPMQEDSMSFMVIVQVI